MGVSKFKINFEIKPRSLATQYTMSDKTFKWDIEQWKNYTLADSNFNKLDWIDGVIDRSHDNLSNQNGPEFCRYNNNNVVIAVYAVYPDILEKGIFKKDGILQVLYTFFKIIFQFLKKQYRTAGV